MKAKEIRDMSRDEMITKLEELKKDLFNLRFQLATNQLENPIKIVAVKRDIARINTIIREQEISQ